MTRCELCGRLLDPSVFHDDTPEGGQVCERCCELCNQGKKPEVNDDDMVELTVTRRMPRREVEAWATRDPDDYFCSFEPEVVVAAREWVAANPPRPTPPTPADVLARYEGPGDDLYPTLPLGIEHAEGILDALHAAGYRLVRHDPDLATTLQKVAELLRSTAHFWRLWEGGEQEGADMEAEADALDRAAALLDGQENDA